MINKGNYNDFLMITSEGEIAYAALSNTEYFGIETEDIIGRNIRDIYPDIDNSYPTLKAAREGIASEYFESELMTVRGIKQLKTGCTYPIFVGDKPAGAVEFSEFQYSRDRIKDIEKRSDFLILNHNNTRYRVDDIFTEDPKMIELKHAIENYALSDSSVMIYGETGTGKELVAQALHNGSRRYTRKFVSLNCGAIPENLAEGILFGTTKGSFTGAEDKAGLFEMAEGSTLFLDEINSLSTMMQVKLLHAIESKSIRRIGSTEEIPVDVRIIAATNEDPFKLVEEGRMKLDFVHRICAIYLEIPPLRKRRKDIAVLTNHFIDYFNAYVSGNIEHIDEEMEAFLMDYDWPGNVRELRNVVEGAFAFSSDNRITRELVPGYIVDKINDKRRTKGFLTDQEELEEYIYGDNLKAYLNSMEKHIVSSAMEASGGKLTEAAGLLGISKQLTKYKLNKYACEVK